MLLSHTSAGADVVILGGDLNMHPQDLGNRLLRAYTGLQDSYLETAKFDVCISVNLCTNSECSNEIKYLFLFMLILADFSAFKFTSLQVEIRRTVAVIELPCMQLCRL